MTGHYHLLIIPFVDKDRTLQEAKAHFPFKVFYDQNQHLAAKLGINRVPIKLFVEDGTIKRGWGGAMIQQARKERFLRLRGRSKRFLYLWHRRLGFVACMAIILWSLSGICHPLMS